MARTAGIATRLAAIGLGAAVLGAAAWFTFGPGAGPPVQGCEVAAELPVSSSTQHLIAAATTVRWSATELPAGIDDSDEQVMLDVVAFRDGFVAVGREADGPHWHAFMLRSTDGLRWDQDPGDEQRFAAAEIRSLVTAGDRLFGIGSVSTNDRGGSRGAVWYSDDGRAWHEATGAFDETYLSALAFGEKGLLLIGTTGGDPRPKAWTSPDGGTWVAQPLDLPVPPEYAQFGALTAFGDGWLAAGSVSRGVDTPTAPVIWRSADGRSWSCQRLDGGGFEVAQPVKLYRSGTGWLAVGIAGHLCGPGASCVGYPIAWASDNGPRWTGAITQGEPIEQGGTAYAGSQRGFLTVGHRSTWVSADGMRWRSASDGGTGHLVAGGADAFVMGNDGRIVAVGTTYDGTDADPLIVFGEASFGS